jgi:hypothetical protein
VSDLPTISKDVTSGWQLQAAARARSGGLTRKQIDILHVEAECNMDERGVAIAAALSTIDSLTAENATLKEQLAARERECGELRPLHKCKCVARIHNMMPGRDWWLGELTEKVPEWPHETHCLHIKTPLKEIVLLCNMGDLQGLAVLCDIPWPIVNPTWKERMKDAYERAALNIAPAAEGADHE